jgi:hypothetical protein
MHWFHIEYWFLYNKVTQLIVIHIYQHFVFSIVFFPSFKNKQNYDKFQLAKPWMQWHLEFEHQENMLIIYNDIVSSFVLFPLWIAIKAIIAIGRKEFGACWIDLACLKLI